MNAKMLTVGLAVLGLVVALFAGVVVGEGSYRPVCIALGAVLFCCFFAVFGRNASPEAKLLALLVFGYTSFQRLFAELNIGHVVYIGEIGLATILFLVGARIAFRRTNPFPPHALTVPIVLLLLVGGARLYLLDYKRFGLLSARDFATIYYSLFYFIGYVVGENDASSNLVRRAFRWGVICYVPLICLFRGLGYFSGFWAWVAGILGTRDMASVVPTVAALFCLMYAGYQKRRLWLLPTSIVPLLLVIVVNERSSYLACTAGLIVVLYATSRNNLAFAFRLAGAGLLVALALGLIVTYSSYTQERTLDPIIEKATTIIDFDAIKASKTATSGQSGVHSMETNRWRTTWWRLIYQEVMATNPVFGLGFGYDLTRKFVREYYADRGDVAARNPHNILFTYLGRMGLIGMTLFGVLILILFRNVFRVAAAVRRNRQPREMLELWLFLFVTMIVALFSHTLEGPMASIPFWSFLGIAVAQQLRLRAARWPAAETILDDSRAQPDTALAGVS